MGIFESTYDKIEEYFKNLDKDLMDSTDECDEENEDDVEDIENEETEEKQHSEDSDVDSEGDEIENGDLDSEHEGVNMEVDLTKLEMFELNLKKRFDGNDVDGYKEIMNTLNEVKKYSVAKELNQTEMDNAIEAINKFKIAISKNVLDLNVQPKAHFLVSHMPHQIGDFKSLNYFSEQPIESLHALINKNMIRIAGLNQEDG
uniref:RNA polymerase subunit sigma n=1 Tax=Rhabditophanes sp. KR3021 TaxID=114890 RepID=A0AC35TLK0_9BILA